MSENSINGSNLTLSRQINIVLVTYSQSCAELVSKVYKKLDQQYAAVHLYKKYEEEEFESRCRTHPLKKRPLILIVLNLLAKKQIDKVVTSLNNYDKWYHYGYQNQLALPINIPKLSFQEMTNLQEQSLSAQITKDLQLQFTWVGTANRLGSQTNEFVETLTKKQNFQTTKTLFMQSFISILNRKLKEKPESDGKPIETLLDECKEQSEARIEQIQEKMQTLVCQRFNVRTIVEGITQHFYLTLLKSRNYFKIIWIEEPVLTRFQMFKNMVNSYGFLSLREWLNLQNFLALDDYWYINFVQKIGKEAVFTINKSNKESWSGIIEKNYSNIIREYRPTFDQYFLQICEILKTRGGCIKEAVGSIIVKNKRIISTGYNGTPTGSTNCYRGGCRVCDNSQKMNTIVLSCNCIHAQYSCIIEAGIQLTPGCILYTTRLPCLWCAKVIVQARISVVVYLKTEYGPLAYKNEQKVYELLKQASIELRMYQKNEKKFSQ